MRARGDSATRLRRAHVSRSGHADQLELGRLDSGPNPVYHVYLDWQLEPELAIGCSDDIVFPQDFGYGWQDAVLRAKPLYRCGMRKPRRCKLTIGRERTYVFNVTQSNGATSSSTVHLKWSVTFTAAGRS